MLVPHCKDLLRITYTVEIYNCWRTREEEIIRYLLTNSTRTNTSRGASLFGALTEGRELHFSTHCKSTLFDPLCSFLPRLILLANFCSLLQNLSGQQIYRLLNRAVLRQGILHTSYPFSTIVCLIKDNIMKKWNNLAFLWESGSTWSMSKTNIDLESSNGNN